MRTAFSITITQNSIGVLAVMILLAFVSGAVVWLVSGILVFSNMDRGGTVLNIVGYLRWPLIILAFLLGGWLGYWLM